MVNHKLPNDGKLKFSENLAALYYLNPNNQLITQNYSAEIAKADPKGAEEYKYIPKPFKGYYITLNSKIEEIDGSLKNISKAWNHRPTTYIMMKNLNLSDLRKRK